MTISSPAPSDASPIRWLNNQPYLLLSLTSLFLGVLMQSERDSLSVRADRALRAERARIARDMHDVVGHAVALMVVQAEAGPLLVRNKPERAEAAFEAISAAGRDAMAQLRGLLGTLHQDEGGREPLPTLADLDDLLGRLDDTERETASEAGRIDELRGRIEILMDEIEISLGIEPPTFYSPEDVETGPDKRP